MKNYKENYKGWVIESHGSGFRYYEKNKRAKTSMIGDDIIVIRKQIDLFNA